MSLTINPCSQPLVSMPVNFTTETKPAAAPTQSSPLVPDGFEFSCGEAPATHRRAGLFQVMLPEASMENFECSSQEPQDAANINTAAVATENTLPDNPTDSQVATFCNNVALSGKSLEERTEIISQALADGVARTTDTPDASWEKATPQQVKLYVQETLEHTDAIRSLGELRGQDFTEHDLEPQTGKFEPRLAQYMALPGRGDNVKWAIAEHNASPHHATWKNPEATKDELAESASDIVNAWRMERRVYEKPSWSWERIAGVIDQQFQYNELSINQRDALLEAIPFQMEVEA